MAITKPEITIKVRPKMAIFKPFYRVRDWYLYAVLPYDKSFWESLKNPSFLFWKTLQVIPIYGIQTGAYLVLFVSIDKTDEYQLVNYILSYKNIQFFTMGLLQIVVGYFEYFYCATIVPGREGHEAVLESRQLAQKDGFEVYRMNPCFEHGPGTFNNLYLSLLAYLGQLLLIYFALTLTVCSHSRADYIDEQMKIQKRQRGGRLYYFMLYDFLAFLLSLAFTCTPIPSPTP